MNLISCLFLHFFAGTVSGDRYSWDTLLWPKKQKAPGWSRLDDERILACGAPLSAHYTAFWLVIVSIMSMRGAGSWRRLVGPGKGLQSRNSLAVVSSAPSQHHKSHVWTLTCTHGQRSTWWVSERAWKRNHVPDAGMLCGILVFAYSCTICFRVFYYNSQCRVAYAWTWPSHSVFCSL